MTRLVPRRPTLALILTVCASLPAMGARGVAELSLDASAVRALVATRLPEPVHLAPRGFGELTLSASAPTRLAFREGAIEVEVPLAVRELGWSAPLRLRLVPGVERTTGTLRLEVAEARVDLPFQHDLRDWLEPIELPRQLEWTLPSDAGAGLAVHGFLQGLRVEPERLVIELALQL